MAEERRIVFEIDDKGASDVDDLSKEELDQIQNTGTPSPPDDSGEKVLSPDEVVEAIEKAATRMESYDLSSSDGGSGDGPDDVLEADELVRQAEQEAEEYEASLDMSDAEEATTVLEEAFEEAKNLALSFLGLITTLTTIAVSVAEDAASFNAEAAEAKGIASAEVTLAQIERAQEVGDESADFFQAQGEVEKELVKLNGILAEYFLPLISGILKIITRILEVITPAVDFILGGLASIPEFFDALLEIAEHSLGKEGMLGTIGKMVHDMRSMMGTFFNWMMGEDDKKKARNIVFDFFDDPFDLPGVRDRNGPEDKPER